MSVDNGILMRYFLLGTKIILPATMMKKLLTILYVFMLSLVAGENGFQRHVDTSKT